MIKGTLFVRFLFFMIEEDRKGAGGNAMKKNRSTDPCTDVWRISGINTFYHSGWEHILSEGSRQSYCKLYILNKEHNPDDSHIVGRFP